MLPIACEFEVDVGPEMDVLRVALGRIAPGTFVAPGSKSVARLAAVSPWAAARCLVLPGAVADELSLEIESASAASRFLEAALDSSWLRGATKQAAMDAPEDPLVRQLESQVKDWRSLGLVQVARCFESAVLPLLEGLEPRDGWLTPLSPREQRIVNGMRWIHITGLLLHSALLPVRSGVAVPCALAAVVFSPSSTRLQCPCPQGLISSTLGLEKFSELAHTTNAASFLGLIGTAGLMAPLTPTPARLTILIALRLLFRMVGQTRLAPHYCPKGAEPGLAGLVTVLASAAFSLWFRIPVRFMIVAEALELVQHVAIVLAHPPCQVCVGEARQLLDPFWVF